MKIHVHSEQFDGYLHAACGRLDEPRSSAARIVGEDKFDAVPYSKRCRLCAVYNYPHGGEPA